MICLRLTCQETFFSTAIMVVTAPMSSVNAIAVEAFKKYILVSLIQNRQPYMQLTSSYSSAKVSELETCIQTNREKFESDNNLGPMKQAVSSMYKRNIQRLTQACLTLSLQDIANTVQLNSPKEAEMHVLQIVVSYAIIPDAKHATIVYIILLLHFL